MRLAKREKYLVILTACGLALLLVLKLLVFPLFDKRSRMARAIKTKEAALVEMAMLSRQYEALTRGSRGVEEAMARRTSGFTLFSFLERAAGERHVKQHIKYMKPSVVEGLGPLKESMVEMRLEAISLKQLVEYLYEIESSKDSVTIKRLSITESKAQAGYLDAVLQVLALLPPE